MRDNKNSTAALRKTASDSKLDEPKQVIASEEKLAQLREELRLQRQKIHLFYAPFSTLRYFFLVVLNYIWDVFLYFKSHTKLVFFFSFLIVHFGVLYFTPGDHQPIVRSVQDWFFIGGYWVFLGILSSVGLGSGLHTFVLYLGPHIALVTLAAYECNSTDFEVYGPNRYLCPNTIAGSIGSVTFWQIFRKVQLEAFLWGAGTAIGELPPYFVARAARLAGEKVEGLDDGSEEESDTFINRNLAIVKKKMLSLLGNLGFFGILLFASIPNPLFDLAGITCGHFLVPFWTFFGATLIGKAVIKSHIQTAFVITMFSKTLVEFLIKSIEGIVPAAAQVIEAFLAKERSKLHGNQEVANPEKSNLSIVWDLFLFCMIAYFAITLINSSVQDFLAKRDEIQLQLKQKEKSTEHKE